MCACFFVKAIAKTSQNIKWETSVDGTKVSHKLIRRVSIDQFYALVTGENNAFYQIGMALPDVIQSVVNEAGEQLVPHDIVYDQLYDITQNSGIAPNDIAISIAIYMLVFGTHFGFNSN